VSGVDMVRLVGQGTFPAGHFGTTEPLTLAASSHRGFHLTPLDEETMEKEHSTRFQRWHMDAQLFPKGNHTARVTSLWAHTVSRRLS
jgi:xanthine dioxygenase